MIEKIPVSVYVLTTNNRRTIEQCLRSLSWAEELVVVDSFSQDGTCEICKQYTDKLFQRKWTGHRDQYQYAADLTTQDWIMFVDADEEIPPELSEEIRTELNGRAKEFDGYFVYRRTYYLGRWIRYGGWYPDGEIRLYRRAKGRWEGGLHAKLVVDGKVGVLKNQYFHYTYGNISDQIQTIDKYSNIAAVDLFQSGEKFSLFKLLFHPPFRFIKEYLFKSGFWDGLPGFVIIVSTMFYVFIKYAKLWELTISPPSQKATPACHNACLREAAPAKAGTSADTGLPGNGCEKGNPPKL
jgi:glycosyltransferase involved in cell wall biosynthesis